MRDGDAGEHTDWTHYDVVDLDGKVTVSAVKSDVYIDARASNAQQAKQSSAVRAARSCAKSEQKSREEKCGAAYTKALRSLPGVGAVLNSLWVRSWHSDWPALRLSGVLGSVTTTNPSVPGFLSWHYPERSAALYHSVTTAFTRFRGWSTSYPLFTATW